MTPRSPPTSTTSSSWAVISSSVPDAGDDFVVVADERLAKEVAQQRDAKRREQRLVAQAGNRMEDILSQMGEGAAQAQLNLVVKANVHGSMQALREALTGLSNDQIRINVIGSGVGGITESDAQLAATSKATVIGFNAWVQAAEKAGTTDTDPVLKAIVGVEVPNLTGSMAKVLPNHHLTKPVLIGEIRDDGQFDIVSETEPVAGDAWTDFLPESAVLDADWQTLKCGMYNTTTKTCVQIKSNY